MSAIAPFVPSPSCGREMPRWSVAGKVVGLPASIAGLPFKRACVRVAPPLKLNEPRSGSMPVMSVGVRLMYTPAVTSNKL